MDLSSEREGKGGYLKDIYFPLFLLIGKFRTKDSVNTERAAYSIVGFPNLAHKTIDAHLNLNFI